MHHGTCECRMRSERDRERKPVPGARLLDTAGPVSLHHVGFPTMLL